MELTRHRKKRLILVTMQRSIQKLTDMLTTECAVEFKSKNTPMNSSQFLTTEAHFEALPPEAAEFITDKNKLHLYMSILGSLNWIAGVRFDILLPVIYLAWNAKSPRQHHLQVALHAAQYLHRTSYLPLVLGGDPTINLTSYCDASLGSAPNGRSIIGSFTKLSPLAGAISAFSHATPSTYTSIFEGELEALHLTTKVLNTTRNILLQFYQLLDASAFNTPTIHADNHAVNEFVKGVGQAKAVKHIQLRLWYVRDHYHNLNINIQDIEGKDNPADKLTKLPDTLSIFPFLQNIMGLTLIDAPNHLNQDFYSKVLISDTVDDPLQYPFDLLNKTLP